MNVRAKVVRVVDGDTVWVRVRVRLTKSAPDVGIDAVHATAELQKQLPFGTAVQIIMQAIDKYGRIVGRLIDDPVEEEPHQI